MAICLSDDFEYNEEDIDKAIDLRISVQMVTHSLPRKTQEYMGILLKKYLEECEMGDYYYKLDYCLSEILVNAIKANIKRLYFTEHNLDINNPEDYETGMKNFREEMISKKSYYQEKLCQSNLYVTYTLKAEDSKLIIEVRNNSVMTEAEKIKVKDKIDNAISQNPENFLNNEIDESEGAGLGIKSIIMTLNSFGLPGDHYMLYTENNETVARLTLEQPVIEIIEEL